MLFQALFERFNGHIHKYQKSRKITQIHIEPYLTKNCALSKSCPTCRLSTLEQHIQHVNAISGVFWVFQWTESQIPKITQSHANSCDEPYLTKSCTFLKSCPTCRLTTLKQHIQHFNAISGIIWAFQWRDSQIPTITQNHEFSPIWPKIVLSRKVAPHAD